MAFSNVILPILMLVIGISISSQVYAAQTCNTDLMGIVINCERFVEKSGPKIAPSPECCGLVKNADVPCVCALLSGEIEDMISMEKVVYVARSCGKKISPGTKCGSYTVPRA